jgi:hypothetical protein
MQDKSGKFVAFFVGLVGLIASVIGIYTFLTGNSSVVDVVPTRTPTVIVATLTATEAPPRVEATPTAGIPSRTATPTRLPAPVTGVLASYPTERNLQTLPTIWSKNKLDFVDMTTPGTQEYQVDGKRSDNLIWNFSWCAVDQAQLEKILAPLTVDFLIGDASLGEDVVRQYEATERKSGDHCRYWATKLTDWSGGKRLKLTIQYDLAEAINDGRRDYTPGRYSQVIWVAVDN